MACTAGHKPSSKLLRVAGNVILKLKPERDPLPAAKKRSVAEPARTTRAGDPFRDQGRDCPKGSSNGFVSTPTKSRTVLHRRPPDHAFCMIPSAIMALLAKRKRWREVETIWS